MSENYTTTIQQSFSIFKSSLHLKIDEIREKDPLKSSFICFADAIRGQKIDEISLRSEFEVLVDKNDYQENEKEEILNFLKTYTKKRLKRLKFFRRPI